MQEGQAIHRRKTLLSAIVSALALTWAPAVMADAISEYPTRPVRVVVPYPAGGNTDVITREVTRRMAAKLGQTFVVENKPGANSIIGTEAVAKAAPDGYTLLVVIGAYANNFALYKKLPYSRSDLAPVAQLTRTSLVLVTAKPGIISIRQLVASGHNKADPLTYASSGVGSAAYILSERFAKSADIAALQHVLLISMQS